MSGTPTTVWFVMQTTDGRVRHGVVCHPYVMGDSHSCYDAVREIARDKLGFGDRSAIDIRPWAPIDGDALLLSDEPRK